MSCDTTNTYILLLQGLMSIVNIGDENLNASGSRTLDLGTGT
jgi:hypothetical protein